MFLFFVFNYSGTICCNFCHRFSPSFSWIIDGPFRLQGIHRALIPSGCISHIQKYFRASSLNESQRYEKGCHLAPVFPPSRRQHLRHLISRWLRNYSNLFTKSSSSHWFSLWVTPRVKCDTFRFLPTNDNASGSIWRVLKLKNHLGNPPPHPPLLQPSHPRQ